MTLHREKNRGEMKEGEKLADYNTISQKEDLQRNKQGQFTPKWRFYLTLFPLERKRILKNVLPGHLTLE